MFLPEQHDGNFSNYHRLAVYSGDVQRFRKHFAEALICYREGQDRFPKISDYYVRYEGILSNPHDNTLRDMQRSLQDGIQQIKTYTSIDDITRYQIETLSPLGGGYRGAQQIASRIKLLHALRFQAFANKFRHSFLHSVAEAVILIRESAPGSREGCGQQGRPRGQIRLDIMGRVCGHYDFGRGRSGSSRR